MPSVLVTGANRGLGLEFPRRYLERGLRVIAVSRGGSEALDRLAEHKRLHRQTADLTDPAALQALAEDLPAGSLELGEEAVAVALHPGWVRTDMGGPKADIDVETSVAGMMAVIEALGPEDSGGFFAYDGSRLAY